MKTTRVESSFRSVSEFLSENVNDFRQDLPAEPGGNGFVEFSLDSVVKWLNKVGFCCRLRVHTTIEHQHMHTCEWRTL